MTLAIIRRVDAGDRALFARWTLQAGIESHACRVWRALTHLGGATCTLAATLVPVIAGGPARGAARDALVVLVVSHLLVQAVKRSVGRPRPSRSAAAAALVAEPDRFSFPSGHAAAAMSLAMGYAGAYPALAPLFTMLAVLVGLSRVALGVHYPGDVFAGQLIALAAAAGWWMR